MTVIGVKWCSLGAVRTYWNWSGDRVHMDSPRLRPESSNRKLGTHPLQFQHCMKCLHHRDPECPENNYPPVCLEKDKVPKRHQNAFNSRLCSILQVVLSLLIAWLFIINVILKETLSVLNRNLRADKHLSASNFLANAVGWCCISTV